VAKAELKTKKKKDEVQSDLGLSASAIQHNVDSILSVMDATAGTEEQVAKLRQQVMDKISEHAFDLKMRENFKEEYLDPWLRKFFAIFKGNIALREGEAILAIPRMFDYQYGWLVDSDEGYNYFKVKQVLTLLVDLPEWLQRQLNFTRRALPIKLEGQVLVADPLFDEKVLARYGKYLLGEESPGHHRINPRLHLELVANLIRDGIFPYSPAPIDQADVNPVDPPRKLEPWQQRAWEDFQKYGNIGIYWPTGGGKSRFMHWLVAKMKGPHLIFVHNNMLKEQWKQNLDELKVPPDQYEIVTYQSVRKVLERAKGKQYGLLVFEETHHLPADTFSLASLIPAKYRIGGTGTPFREDGREDLIFALTGKPIGLTWDEFIRLGVIKKPEVHLHIVKTVSDKLVLASDLVFGRDLKTFLFVFSLAIGRKLASMLDVQFVSGETKPEDRMKLAKSERTLVISGVGREGVSIQDLQMIVEVDWFYGSRNEEAQTIGRLMHSKFKGEHHVLMTEEEYQKYQKRLWPILEMNIRIVVHHAGALTSFDWGGSEGDGTSVRAPKVQSIGVRRSNRNARHQKPTDHDEEGEPLGSNPSGQTTTEQLGPTAPLLQFKGIQKMLSRLSRGQRVLVEMLLREDGTWYSRDKLSFNLGYSSTDSFRVSTKITDLVERKVVEEKREGKTTFYRTNYRGRLA